MTERPLDDLERAITSARSRLVPLETSPVRRTPGGWEGGVRIADDFDAPLPPDLLAAFGA